MRLSIVIVSWNTREVLAACLASLESELERLAPDSVETFVVDNASSDGSPEHIRRRFAWVKLVENDENVGFATANNRAIVESSGEFVLLLNPDTKVMDGAISSLIEFMSSTPDAGAAGSHLLNPDGTLQISSWPAPTLSRELWRLLHLDSVRSYAEYPASTWTVDAPKLVDSVQGASMILRRKALEDVGLLDAQYFMYTEEIDLCLRIRNAGWRVYWVPQSRGRALRRAEHAAGGLRDVLAVVSQQDCLFSQTRGHASCACVQSGDICDGAGAIELDALACLSRRCRRTAVSFSCRQLRAVDSKHWGVLAGLHSRRK